MFWLKKTAVFIALLAVTSTTAGFRFKTETEETDKTETLAAAVAEENNHETTTEIVNETTTTETEEDDTTENSERAGRKLDTTDEEVHGRFFDIKEKLCSLGLGDVSSTKV